VGILGELASISAEDGSFWRVCGAHGDVDRNINIANAVNLCPVFDRTNVVFVMKHKSQGDYQ